MDPKKKEFRAARRVANGFKALTLALNTLRMSIVKLDDNVYVIGKKEMCLYVKEIVDEAVNPAPDLAPSTLPEQSDLPKDEA